MIAYGLVQVEDNTAELSQSDAESEQSVTVETGQSVATVETSSPTNSIPFFCRCLL